MITITTAAAPMSSRTEAHAQRLTREDRREARLQRKADAAKEKRDRLFAEGKCINHTNKTPHAPRRPNGRRCDPCCAIRRVPT